MLTVREMTSSDKDAVRSISNATASGIYKNKPEATQLLFCDYYADNGIGFLLCDGDKIAGYVLCSEDYKKYIKLYKLGYLEKLKKADKKEYLNKKFSLIFDRLMGKRYPAHLHIDILESYCGGTGKLLMEPLLNRLKKDNIRGVWLGVDPQNVRAVKFYKKFGFTSKGIFKLFSVYTLKIT